MAAAKQTITKRQEVPVCRTWPELLKALGKTKSEAVCLALMDLERSGKNRMAWKLRIHGRFNLLRGQRERKEIAAE